MKQKVQYLAVLRHGQTPPNVQLEQPTDSFFYEVSGSDINIGLTELGIVQVDDVSLFVAQFLGDIQIARIICSQFYRTRQTAEILQRVLPNQPAIIEDERVAKRHYGKFWNITYQGVQALYPHEYVKFTKLGGYLYRPPEGENYLDLRERILDFKRERIDGTNESLCISTHSAAALMFEQILLGEMSDDEVLQRYETIALPNATVTIYRRVSGHKRIFGLTLDPIAWCKRALGKRHSAWEKVTSYTPQSARRSKEPVNSSQDKDSLIDREDRVA